MKYFIIYDLENKCPNVKWSMPTRNARWKNTKTYSKVSDIVCASDKKGLIFSRCVFSLRTNACRSPLSSSRFPSHLAADISESKVRWKRPAGLRAVQLLFVSRPPGNDLVTCKTTRSFQGHTSKRKPGANLGQPNNSLLDIQMSRYSIVVFEVAGNYSEVYGRKTAQYLCCVFCITGIIDMRLVPGASSQAKETIMVI